MTWDMALITVNCQTSHVPCHMYLSNHLLTQWPADQMDWRPWRARV